MMLRDNKALSGIKLMNKEQLLMASQNAETGATRQDYEMTNSKR